MKVIEKAAELRLQWRHKGDWSASTGFIPTMGALHKGHLSLVERAKAECDITIASIFVNPTQFNDREDLKKYPRTIGKDTELLEKAGCDYLFLPSIEELYPETPGNTERPSEEGTRIFKAELSGVDFGMMGTVMEGQHRPGHFDGVAVIVYRLLNAVRPGKAFFGQKDFQQLAIVKSLVKQTGLRTEIIACPTVREENGLAMSSRNERLAAEERKRAGLISKVLFAAKEKAAGAETGAIKKWVRAELEKEPLFMLEYVEIADRDTLQLPGDKEKIQNAVLCIALKIGSVRLIDNVLL